MARIVAGNEISTSRTADQLTAQHSAINMLTGRVKLILEYMKVKKKRKKRFPINVLVDFLKAVERGDVPRNHEILRQVRALSHRLPVLESSRFQPDFFTQVKKSL